MDRYEAYTLLARELARLQETKDWKSLADGVTSLDLTGESGVRYTMSFELQRGSDGRTMIKGSIHDNNTWNFELLEEQIQVR